MENKDIIVYGAYGYTGELIVRRCQELGIKALLSGRNEAKLKPIAEKYGFRYQVADLKADELDKLLSGAKVVIHAAGPFIHTSKAMVEACIRNGVHYTDITGEIAVFAQARKYDQQAKDAGVMLLPGTGFDIVPSDCLAAHLKSRMPEAKRIDLTLITSGGMSRGTKLTVVEGLGYGGAVRENGKIKKVPEAFDIKEFEFEGRNIMAATIPWGDVYTAYFSTGIPNIRVYYAMPPKAIKQMKIGRYLGWLLRAEFVKNRLRSKVNSGKPGPSEKTRSKSHMTVVGEVEDEAGNLFRASIRTQDAYVLTADASVHIAQQIVKGNFKPGFQTPSLAYGKDVICEVTGAQFVDL